MNFIKYTFATVVGIMIFLLCVSVVLFGVFFSIAKSSQKATIKDNSVLHLTLSNSIHEKGKENPLQAFNIEAPKQLNIKAKTSLHDLREAILYAQKDARIKGIYLNINTLKSGHAVAIEIRDALESFKSSGKFVYAYGDYFSEGAYLLASVSDEIMLNPTGALEFNGMHVEKIFFTGLFKKLGVKPRIFRVGDFKAAVEPFFRENMSDENRLQTQVLLDDLNSIHLRKIADSRNIPYATVKNISDSMLVRNSGDALNYQLITDTVYEHTALENIRKKLKIEKDDKINFVKLSQYSEVVKQENFKYSSNKVAVILTEGAIANQKGDENEISPEDVIHQLRKVKQDEAIKAVVLRINSPGGSLLGSDNLWKEIQLLKKEKPVIASMSDLAASGGYYMAMGCDKIVASPATITGSIGIFGLTFEFQNLATGMFGLTFDRVKTGVFSDLGNLNRPMTEQEQQIIQKMIHEGYQKFTSKAATGRNIPIDELLKVASGRVWSGKQAKEVNLVDELGGFQKAVDIALELAEIPKDDYSLKYYPQQSSFLENIISAPNVYYQTQALENELGVFYPYFTQLKNLQKRQGIQAWMPLKVKF